ncbi:MAG: hypothetical protein ACEPOV_10680 [Hyphomicrobiales bacterium]
MEENNYSSSMFNKLTGSYDGGDLDNFIGMIAYCYYKKSKVEYIERFRNENNGNTPTHSELETFQYSQCVPSTIKTLRSQGETITTTFVNELLNDKNIGLSIREVELDDREKILASRELELKNGKLSLEKKKDELSKRETNLNKQKKELDKRDSNLRKRESVCKVSPKKTIGSKVWMFSLGIFQSIIASFLFVILSALLIFAFSHNNDLIAFIKSMF